MIDFDFNDREKDEDHEVAWILRPEAKCYKEISSVKYRHAYSEIQLFDLMGVEELKAGYVYHIISGGDIDSISFIKMILRYQKIEYLILSTWSMSIANVDVFIAFLKKKQIGRIDAYLGDIFIKRYKSEFDVFCANMKKYGNGGRVCTGKNHAKVYAGFGEKFYFTIEGSANINMNPRIENTMITCGKPLYLFYKDFFDNLENINEEFEEWKPY